MGLGLHDSEACAPDHHTLLPTHGKTAFQLGETDYQCAPRKPVRNCIANATRFHLLKGIQEKHGFEHEEHQVPVPGLPSTLCVTVCR